MRLQAAVGTPGMGRRRHWADQFGLFTSACGAGILRVLTGQHSRHVALRPVTPH
jgi:hypothetical protein